MRHAIEQVTAERGRPDAVMLLQATSPVRHDDTLARALAEFADTGVDSMVGVVEQPPFIWQAGDPPTAAYDVAARPRRQDLTDETRRYRETGSLYVTRTEIYEQHDNRLGGRIGLFVMAEDEGIDIDTELDVALAARLLGGSAPMTRWFTRRHPDPAALATAAGPHPHLRRAPARRRDPAWSTTRQLRWPSRRPSCGVLDQGSNIFVNPAWNLGRT